MSNDMFDVDVKINYKNEEFTVIETLYIKGNDLYLVVKTNDLMEKQFPLPTFIIPKDA